MKASALIEELQKLIDEYGNKEVVDEYGWSFDWLKYEEEDKEFVLTRQEIKQEAQPVGWIFEHHEFGSVWKRNFILNRPDGRANPPASYHGSPVRNVRPLYTSPTIPTEDVMTIEELVKELRRAVTMHPPLLGSPMMRQAADKLEELLEKQSENAAEADEWVRRDRDKANNEWRKSYAALVEKDKEIAALRDAGLKLMPYLRWTIGPESLGHHPTMPSAVSAFIAALEDRNAGGNDEVSL